MMFRFDDRADRPNGFIQMKLAVHNHVIKGFHTLEFFACRGDPQRQSVWRFSFAGFQPAHQLLFAFCGDENHQSLISHLADGFGTLDVDAHDHIHAGGKRLAYLLFGYAFVIAIDDRMFYQFVLIDHACKLFF